jgi:hypothetical protein
MQASLHNITPVPFAFFAEFHKKRKIPESFTHCRDYLGRNVVDSNVKASVWLPVTSESPVFTGSES